MKLDKKDSQILWLMEEDSSLTTKQLSKRTGIPIATVHNRIKKLEREGIIQGYTLRLDHVKLGKAITAIILVSVTYAVPETKAVSQREISRKIKRMGADEVMIITGEHDIMVKLRVHDVDELDRFITKKIRAIKGVDKTRTVIVLREI